MNLELFTVNELLSLYRKKELLPSDVVKGYLARIALIEPKIRAFITVLKDESLTAALELKKTSEPTLNKPLWGIPVAIKDNICTKTVKTTAGSRILESFVPPYDATVLERLKNAGAIIIGKTNCDEFAMGSSTENSAFFPTKNPWNLSCVPGGSSGGSAAAVASLEAPLALGSDTGGSVRQPAAFCGVVGLKPTYGAVSRYGLIAFASSLDQIGPFGRTVLDAALIYKVIAGHDPNDSTSAPQDFFNWEFFNAVDIAINKASCATIDDAINSIINTALKEMVIGIPEDISSGLDPVVYESMKKVMLALESRGAQLVSVTLPNLEYALAAYYIVASAEASSNLARYDGTRYGLRNKVTGTAYDMFKMTRQEGFGREVKRRIMLGTYALSAGYYDAYYLKAQKVRTLIKRDFEKVFKLCNLILTPTTPTPPFLLGEKIDDPLKMYLSDLYTIPVNMSGLPALAVPSGFTESGLPLGVQFIGQPFQEGTLFKIGLAVEEALSIKRYCN